MGKSQPNPTSPPPLTTQPFLSSLPSPSSPASKEESRLKQEMANMKREEEELTTRLSHSQDNIFRCRQKLDSLKQEMDWNEQELQAWLVRRRGGAR